MDVKGFIKTIISSIPTLKISSVTRIGLELELQRQFKRLKAGIVLDVGSGGEPYKNKIPHTEFMSLDIEKKNNPDICCDAHAIKWRSNYFDTVIATEVLEHLHTPEKAVDEIHRVLKPDGICIASTRFIFPYHPEPKDYYRFTWDSLNYIFRKFSRVEIYHQGNRIHAIWQIVNSGKVGVILNVFNPLIARIYSKHTKFPCGFVVYAKK